MNVFHNKKGIDTRALNLLIAVPIIIISVALFYWYAGDKLNVGQESFIQSNLALVKIDASLAHFEQEKLPQFTVATPSQAESLLKAFFDASGYTIVSNSCTGGENIACEFTVRGTNAPKKTYYRELFIATQKGVRMITLKGDILE